MHNGQRFLQRFGAALAIRHRDAVFAQEIQHFPLAGKRFALQIAHVVKARVQMAGGGDGGVQVAQRPGGGIAGIFQRFRRGFVVGIEG